MLQIGCVKVSDDLEETLTLNRAADPKKLAVREDVGDRDRLQKLSDQPAGAEIVKGTDVVAVRISERRAVGESLWRDARLFLDLEQRLELPAPREIPYKAGC